MQSDKKISICHLISGDLWAGAEVMASQLICTLSKSKNTCITTIVYNNGRLADELKKAGINVIVIEENRHSFPVLVYKTYRTLRTRKIDIIHSHRRKENILALTVAVLIGNIRCVTTLHGMSEFSYKKFSRGSIISIINYFIISRLFNFTITVSDEIRTTLISKHGFSPDKTTTIHNGIQILPDEFLREKSKGQLFTIGTAGRCVPVKDFWLFIAIAKEVCERDTIRFVLAGDGPEFEKLRQKADELFLKNITFMGHINDMSTFYQKIDLFLNTSKHEGIPMTILEAMGQGIPVVAPKVGGIPEIIDNGIDGYLIEDRLPQNYAKTCNLLATNPNIYSALATAAHKKITEKFTVAIMTNKYKKMYSEVFMSI